MARKHVKTFCNSEMLKLYLSLVSLEEELNCLSRNSVMDSNFNCFLLFNSYVAGG